MTEPTSLRVKSSANVSLSTSSAQSAAIGTAGNDFDTEIVRLVSNADVWIAFGANPIAATDGSGDSILLPLGIVEYFRIAAGSKIAGVVASGTGTLSVAWMR